jgi:hypothetical protein
MEFVLLGNDTSALEQRPYNTKNYLRKDSKWKLHIFLVGFFLLRGQGSHTLEGIMTFGLDRAPSKICMFTNAYYLKKKNAGITWFKYNQEVHYSFWGPNYVLQGREC